MGLVVNGREIMVWKKTSGFPKIKRDKRVVRKLLEEDQEEPRLGESNYAAQVRARLQDRTFEEQAMLDNGCNVDDLN